MMSRGNHDSNARLKLIPLKHPATLLDACRRPPGGSAHFPPLIHAPACRRRPCTWTRAAPARAASAWRQPRACRSAWRRRRPRCWRRARPARARTAGAWSCAWRAWPASARRARGAGPGHTACQSLGWGRVALRALFVCRRGARPGFICCSRAPGSVHVLCVCCAEAPSLARRGPRQQDASRCSRLRRKPRGGARRAWRDCWRGCRAAPSARALRWRRSTRAARRAGGQRRLRRQPPPRCTAPTLRPAPAAAPPSGRRLALRWPHPRRGPLAWQALTIHLGRASWAPHR